MTPEVQTAIEEAKERHPASGRLGDGVYVSFLDALEDFELTNALFGPASMNTAQARAYVAELRSQAAEAWRAREAVAR